MQADIILILLASQAIAQQQDSNPKEYEVEAYNCNTAGLQLVEGSNERLW